MELQLAHWSLLASLVAIFAVVRVAWTVGKISDSDRELQRLSTRLEEHLDDFADFRDKCRKWINRDKMREVRDAQKANGMDQSIANAQSHQDVKQALRARLAASQPEE